MEADVVPGMVTVSMVVESISAAVVSAVVVVSSSGRSIEQSDSSSHQRGDNLQFVSLGVTVSLFRAQDALIVQAEFVNLATECFHL